MTTFTTFIEEREKEFDENFARINHIHRGECAITDETGTKFQAHYENGKVTELGGLQSVKDFLTTTAHGAVERANQELLEGLMEEIGTEIRPLNFNGKDYMAEYAIGVNSEKSRFRSLLTSRLSNNKKEI